MKTRLNDVELWDYCRGCNWPWEYCQTGTGRANAKGLQEWVERGGGGYTASLKTCAKVASEIKRYSRMALAVGGGLGEATLS